MAASPERSVRAWAGWAVLACYAAHALELVLRYPAANLLWSCNVAVLVIAGGLLGRSAHATALGTMMLALGNPLWAIEVATTGVLLPTAPLTHLGAFGLGLHGAWALGVPRHVALTAPTAMLALVVPARLAGPASENVNFAFAVPSGWEGWYPSHAAFLGALLAVEVPLALLLLAALRRLGFREPRGPCEYPGSPGEAP